jgi:hypothetical protein
VATPVEYITHPGRHDLFAAVQRHRRLKLPVRQLLEPVARPGDTGVSLDVVIPWSELIVSHGPVDSDTVAKVGFKIEIAPAITLPAPKQ